MSNEEKEKKSKPKLNQKSEMSCYNQPHQMHIRENFFKNRVNTTNTTRLGIRSVPQNFSSLGSGAASAKLGERQSQSVKYHYYPDK